LEDRPVTLTRTEVEVLRLLAKGYQNKEIAEEMFISINTVKSHVSSILRKLRVRNRAQAVRYVYKYGVSQ
ncbi:MAG: response regulator transcription factor, partial [Firmicutes bacterium]|nr:response regulator transcription factor [Bacillota bacterium]